MFLEIKLLIFINHHQQSFYAWKKSENGLRIVTGICYILILMSSGVVAKFIDPWLGDKVNSGIGLSYRSASHVAWRTGSTALCRSWLYTPVRDLSIRLTSPCLYLHRCPLAVISLLFNWIDQTPHYPEPPPPTPSIPSPPPPFPNFFQYMGMVVRLGYHNVGITRDYI